MKHQFGNRAVQPLLSLRDRQFLCQRLRLPAPCFGPGVAAARAAKHPVRKNQMQLKQ